MRSLRTCRPRSWSKVADRKADNHGAAGQYGAELGWWRIHAQLAEAAMLLVLSRLLVDFVRFGRWRGVIGRVVPVGPANRFDEDRDEVDQRDRYLSRVVDRAASRLPFAYRCLPRAMALHWMLTRRGKRTTLVIGVLPGPRRGHLDDLHAWVEMNGEVLIGDNPEPYAILVRLQR